MQVSDEEKILLARGEDAVRLASKQYSVKALGFLTPAEAVFLEKNIKAIRFYQRHGFVITEEKQYEEGTTEYIVKMQR